MVNRRTIGGSLAALAISGIAATTVQPPASADPVGAQSFRVGCGQNITIQRPGGLASATARCANGVLTLKGWVQDTAADGRCAKVRVKFSQNGAQWKDSPSACPAGDRKFYSWQGPTPWVDINLVVS